MKKRTQIKRATLDDVKKSILLHSSKNKKEEFAQSKNLTPELFYKGGNFNNLEVFELDTSLLKRPEYRRKKKSLGGMKALKNSLIKYGIKTPIVVNKRENAEYYIVNGYKVNKMWRALKNKTIPAVVINVPIKQEQELHIHLNRLVQETDLAAILNHLDHLNPEDFDLKGLTPKDEVDDKNHLKKELEKAKKRAEENEKKAIVRWSFIFQRPKRIQLGEIINQLRKELNLKTDSEVLEYLIINYKKQ